MLKKGIDNLWRHGSFVAAIMLVWNSEDAEGVKEYKFISDPFHVVPHVIRSNGIDDSILVDEEMYKTLINRKVARPVTDEEAANANTNSEIDATNAENARALQAQDKEIELAQAEAKAKELETMKNAGKNPDAAPIPVVIAPPVPGPATVVAQAATDPVAASAVEAAAATKGKAK